MIYANIKSFCHIPETDKVLYVNYISILKRGEGAMEKQLGASFSRFQLPNRYISSNENNNFAAPFHT